eukprot:scaffold50056_cov49-Prasinocladus_malaysianus.AAC.1
MADPGEILQYVQALVAAVPSHLAAEAFADVPFELEFGLDQYQVEGSKIGTESGDRAHIPRAG